MDGGFTPGGAPLWPPPGAPHLRRKIPHEAAPLVLRGLAGQVRGGLPAVGRKERLGELLEARAHLGHDGGLGGGQVDVLGGVIEDVKEAKGLVDCAAVEWARVTPVGGGIGCRMGKV